MFSNTAQAIAAEIFAMSEADQQMRTSGQWDATVDEINTRRMREIVQQIGWPSRSKVGEEAAHRAWLLVQHADHDHTFREECLALMKAQPVDEVAPADIAYLEDRVRVHARRPQLYATQFYVDATGAFGPGPVEDPQHVDERRKAVGLAPLAEYVAIMQQVYQERCHTPPRMQKAWEGA
jgi:hypothetical protein